MKARTKKRTDLDTIKAIFTKAGIVFTENASADPIELVVEAKDGPNNVGYDRFVSSFVFDCYGTLLTVGAWE